MEWEVTYWPEGHVVCVKTAGSMTLADLKQMAIDVLAEAAARNTLKILADHRLVRHEIPVVDIYRLPDVFRELGWGPTHTVATVFAPEAGQGVDFTFFDNRAYNTGMSHRLFTDVETARAWLCEQPPR